jgi:hypothetical protein
MFFISDIFSFVFHNSLTLLLLFFSLIKIDERKKQILACCSILLLLLISYFSNVTYNITALILVYAITSKIKARQIIAIAVAIFSFFYTEFRILFFQKLSGETTYIQIDKEAPKASIIPHLTDEKILTTKDDFEVIFTPVMDIDLTARIVYLDEYDKKFSPQDYYSHPLYDALAPLDITIFIGSMADNWHQFKIKHEQRGAWVSVPDKKSTLYKPEEWSNVHVIPKNQTTRNGFKTIKRGDIVRIKGYLVDWQGGGIYDNFKIQTARHFADISEQRLGGQLTLLCMQLFFTELFANGYIFK